MHALLGKTNIVIYPLDCPAINLYMDEMMKPYPYMLSTCAWLASVSTLWHLCNDVCLGGSKSWFW